MSFFLITFVAAERLWEAFWGEEARGERREARGDKKESNKK